MKQMAPLSLQVRLSNHFDRPTYYVHHRLIGKRVVDFLLVLIELFSLGVTAEALRANISLKSAISLHRGPVDPKFQVSISKFQV